MPRPKKRRPNATGRSDQYSSWHVRLHHWVLRTAAYRSLSVGARALLVELMSLYNGRNNGDLFLSVRSAAQRLNCSKNYASKLLAELQERGFIRPNEVGAFNMKVASGRGKATTWILTEMPFGNTAAGTKEFMRWQPTQDVDQDSPRLPRRDSQSLPKGQCGENIEEVSR